MTLLNMYYFLFTKIPSGNQEYSMYLTHRKHFQATSLKCKT